MCFLYLLRTHPQEPISCNYTELLATFPFMPLPVESGTVIERLRDQKDPLKGNYCPVNATKPNNLCE